MLKLPPDTRVFMAVAPVDMRRSFSGLCAIRTRQTRRGRISKSAASSASFRSVLRQKKWASVEF
jgi:hypothetical protein